MSQIVSAQQAAAHIGGVREPINLKEIVDAAILVQALELAHIDIVRLYEELPPITTDRHKLLQILVNFVSNARDAVQSSSIDPQRIIIKLGRDGDDPFISVVDSGIGMSEDVLSGLWRFGFTTKKNRFGFGLHNSANAAREIGASIAAQSEGPGKGASFSVRLPVFC